MCSKKRWRSDRPHFFFSCFSSLVSSLVATPARRFLFFSFTRRCVCALRRDMTLTAVVVVYGWRPAGKEVVLHYGPLALTQRHGQGGTLRPLLFPFLPRPARPHPLLTQSPARVLIQCNGTRACRTNPKTASLPGGSRLVAHKEGSA